MKATNIKWDIDEQDLTEEVLDYATEKEIAELLGKDETMKRIDFSLSLL